MSTIEEYSIHEGFSQPKKRKIYRGLVGELDDLLNSTHHASTLGFVDHENFVFTTLYPDDVSIDQLSENVRQEVLFLRKEFGPGKNNLQQALCLVKYIRVYLSYLNLQEKKGEYAFKFIGHDFLLKLGKRYYAAKKCYLKNKGEDSDSSK